MKEVVVGEHPHEATSPVNEPVFKSAQIKPNTHVKV